ncbi:armadillo repeat-containing protein 5 [Dunckerocampus dactyliophorus]|uniref:armadillo repeat-containing protein 5 n=1 Tax=Dunckerocampus dactyliophorus TaxID=161453 RepID=UPI002405835C|nr:armadillo repeat-containing protein 5 [Dunckerocampus dactyliophorus]
MAASTMQVGWKQSRPSSREGSPSSPELSLTWCLAHLSKAAAGVEHPGHGKAESGGGRELDKRSRYSQWRALVGIRMHHIKGDKAGITRFRTRDGLRPLLDLLSHPECSGKTLDLALSILANCCTEFETRIEVRKLDGINIVVDIMKKNVAQETIQNRAARALGNMAMDSESSALIHSAGGVPLLLLCVSLSSAPSSPPAASPKDSCPKLQSAQSAARALLYLSDTPSNRLALLTQGTLSALAPLIAPEYPQGLRRAALKTLHELTRGCSLKCAREVSRSGVLTQLGVMASGEAGKPFEQLALKTLANVCFQGCLRPLVGSLGVIPRFMEEVKKDQLKSGVFLKALCLCCKEAVNRIKVSEHGGLEVLMSFLAAHPSHPLSRLVILAFVDFVFDEDSLEQLQELGLVPLLVARLVALTTGEEPSAKKMDVGVASSSSLADFMSSSCFESYDFPTLEGSRQEDGGRDQGSSSFLSLRSWLLSEGMISSEEDLLDSSSSADGQWTSTFPQVSPNPYSLSSLKSTSPFNAVTSSTSKKDTQLTSSSPWKVSDSPPSSPQPTQNSLPTISSPSTMTQNHPVSPSEFSEPFNRRQHLVLSSTAKVTLDTPPSALRPPVYYHPYHPEPWTPESPILLLLSRFSYVADPTPTLVTLGTVSGLLHYLTHHKHPRSCCFRLLCRLSCNPNCFETLIRTGLVPLIHHHLCQREGGAGGQTEQVRAKVKQLGLTLLNNLQVQCESSFGSGTLAHVMLAGSESHKVKCALSLPLISSNKSLLRKLLLDTGGLLLALKPLGCHDDNNDDDDESHTCECGQLLSCYGGVPYSDPTSTLHSLYYYLLIGCLSPLVTSIKSDPDPMKSQEAFEADAAAPPPSKKPRRADMCPYGTSTFDLLLLLDDGTEIPANREVVAGLRDLDEVGSEYFRALLTGGFGEAHANAGEAIRIKDVSKGMLLPVLHYLHGCRLAKNVEASSEAEEGRCQFLDKLVLEGLASYQTDTEELTFQKNPLGETMVGACRFLAMEMQKELEDLCVSRLLSPCPNETVSAPSEDHAAASPAGLNRDHLKTTEDHLANRTSELVLTCVEMEIENLSEEMSVLTKASGHQKGSKKPRGRKANTTPKTRESSKSGVSGDSGIKEVKSSAKHPNSHANSLPTSEERGGRGRGVRAPLLPQVYWFALHYNYPVMRRACLTLLLGSPDGGRQLYYSPRETADCLQRLASQAECTDTLKQDLLGLAADALT